MALAPTGSQTFASLARDPIPFVRGLSQLIPERRLAAILTRTDRASERRRSLPAVCELGTQAICGLSIQPLRHGEPSMVGSLLDQLGPGMLLVWDRGFFSYELIRSVCERGAHLLARVESNTILKPLLRPDDGS